MKNKFYQIKCGKCGRILNDPDTGDSFDDKNDLEFVAKESNWIEHNNKWICPNCYYVDDNDEYQLN